MTGFPYFVLDGLGIHYAKQAGLELMGLYLPLKC